MDGNLSTTVATPHLMVRNTFFWPSAVVKKNAFVVVKTKKAEHGYWLGKVISTKVDSALVRWYTKQPTLQNPNSWKIEAGIKDQHIPLKKVLFVMPDSWHPLSGITDEMRQYIVSYCTLKSV